MRLLSYEFQGHSGFGRMEGDDRIVPLAGDLQAALTTGVPAKPAAASIALADVRLHPVIRDPAKIFCVGHNYEEHRRETNGPVVGHPSIFTRFADTLTAHGAPILLPRESTMLDFEGELAVIIGKGGRRIAEADAAAYIAGYACANDVSVRDWQRHTQQFTPGKNFPATAPLGPYLVTPDEIADIDAATLKTRVNGAVMQQASVDQMIFSIARIIAYLSSFTPLSPGDVILTGTPGGVGARRTPAIWLSPGDVVEIEISGIGLLRNEVVAEG